ncbi:penicillin-insensitive murein endopeptidase [Devosia sp. A8/3-2]|nr:penicillin-insensitive murein endopeptidase [Devosia sp. A8/3-2]
MSGFLALPALRPVRTRIRCRPETGCGAELDYWFTDAPYQPSTSPPAAPLTLADLPKACTAVPGAR